MQKPSMTIYVDTSAWVASLCREAQSESVGAWLGAQLPQSLMASLWVKTEISSALSIKCRRGDLRAADLAPLHQSFDEFYHSGSHWASLEPNDFSLASALCKDVASDLRGGDALHLAVALRLKCSHFLSLDHVLNKNALTQGLKLIAL